MHPELIPGKAGFIWGTQKIKPDFEFLGGLYPIE